MLFPLKDPPFFPPLEDDTGIDAMAEPLLLSGTLIFSSRTSDLHGTLHRIPAPSLLCCHVRGPYG